MQEEIRQLHKLGDAIQQPLSKDDYGRVEPFLVDYTAEQARISFRHGFLAASRLWMEITQGAADKRSEPRFESLEPR